MFKPLLLLLVASCVCAIANAQLITTIPTFPRDTGTIALIVDATKGNKGLMNYSNPNDVYVHIGVITNQSTGASDWKHVKFTNFNAPDQSVKAENLGNNKYRFVINNARSFFNLAAGETISKIAILFRNGAGTVVQRNADGSDMFVPMYSDVFATKFLQPAMEPKFAQVPEPINKEVGDYIDIVYASSHPAALKLYYNGVSVAEQNDVNVIDKKVQISSAGNQQVIATATYNGQVIRDTINFFVATTSTVAPLPAGVRDGINYEQGDTSAILVLYAPGKSRVAVIGEFNNWTERSEFQMNKTPDGKRFWKRITGLTKGTVYAYQYLVNSSLRIADPYTEMVLDPDNDKFIQNTTYPNIKAYPTGKTTGIVSTLQPGAAAYAWQVQNFQRPDQRSLVIYEVLLRDFLATHDWKTLRDTLPYLKALGINAIELMPVNEFEGNVSWGYNSSFYFAPDKYYGTGTSMKQFVDEAHKNGIAVIMDIALNHSFGQSPMVQLYWDATNNRPDPSSPWFNPAAKHAFNVGYDFNHQSDATQYFTSRVVEHWLTEYKIDGFRFDLSKGFTQKPTCDANGGNCNVDAWSQYDADRVALWKKYYDTVQHKSAGAYVILEHFADDDEEKELADYGMMLWGNHNYNFSEGTMGYVSNSNFSGAIHTARRMNEPHLVAYMESHDEERVQYKNSTYGNSSSTYNVKNLATGLRRDEMAAAFLFMIPGPKMIWQFGEMGYDFSINYCTDGTVKDQCRLDDKPIRWDYLQDFGRKRLHDAYAGLLKLRQHPSYKDAFVEGNVNSSLNAALKWMHVTTDTSNLLVVGNFDVNQTTGVVQFPHTGTWYDYFTGQSINVTQADQPMTLQPGEYHVYLNRNITNVLTSVRDVFNQRYTVNMKVYPNPVVRSSIIEYELPASGSVSLTINNITGQQIGSPFIKNQPRGTHKLELNRLVPAKQGLPSGTYFIKLEFGGSRKVHQVVIQN